LRESCRQRALDAALKLFALGIGSEALLPFAMRRCATATSGTPSIKNGLRKMRAKSLLARHLKPSLQPLRLRFLNW
jgi:hypothetical protein